MLIIGVFIGLWVVLFAAFMAFYSKKKKNNASFVSENSNKAIVHLHCKKIKINGQDISAYNPITGEYLEKVVALEPGRYTISGIYQTTDNRLNKTINVKSDDVELELDLEGGCTYSAAMYMYSPEEREQYYNGDTDEAVASVPLSIVEGSDFIKAYVICYKEK